jgi:type I restriction enzyme S subunit
MLNYISAEFSRLASGSTFLEISRRDFGAIRVPFPPLSEQRRIAEILDTVDAAIQHTEALIAKLKQIKAGLLHDLLTRGLDEHGQLRDPVTHPEQFKDSPLGRIPRGWTICSLGELVDSAVDGPFGSNLKTEHYVSQPGVRVVRLQNIGNGYFDESDKAYMSGAHARMLQRHEVVAGDLLIASLGDDNHPIARACLYPISTQPGIVKADCFRFRLQRSSAIHAYVMHVLNCPSTRGDINLLGQGVTRDRVNLTIVQKVRLRLPPTPEQERIVVVLDAHDARIRAEEAYRDKLKQLKKGLMDDLLTGRVRVKSTTNHTQEADDDQASLSSVPKMQTED